MLLSGLFSGQQSCCGVDSWLSLLQKCGETAGQEEERDSKQKEGSREVAEEGRDDGPGEEQVKRREGEKEKRKVTS